MTVKEFFGIVAVSFGIMMFFVAGCAEAPGPHSNPRTIQVEVPIAGLLETSVTGRIEQIVPIPLSSGYYAVLVYFDDGRIVNLVMSYSNTFEFWRGKSVKISFDSSGIINSVYKVQ